MMHVQTYETARKPLPVLPDATMTQPCHFPAIVGNVFDTLYHLNKFNHLCKCRFAKVVELIQMVAINLPINHTGVVYGTLYDGSE